MEHLTTKKQDISFRSMWGTNISEVDTVLLQIDDQVVTLSDIKRSAAELSVNKITCYKMRQHGFNFIRVRKGLYDV